MIVTYQFRIGEKSLKVYEEFLSKHSHSKGGYVWTSMLTGDDDETTRWFVVSIDLDKEKV